MTESHSASRGSFLNLASDKLLATSSCALISNELFCYNKEKKNLPWGLRSSPHAKSFAYESKVMEKGKQKHFKRVC